jgi:hypothetical protein
MLLLKDMATIWMVMKQKHQYKKHKLSKLNKHRKHKIYNRKKVMLSKSLARTV